MVSRCWFDAEKALEVILYVAQHTNNMYTILKTLYLADKEHLAKYGRQITGDWYFAPEHGPVGSHTYNILKCARGEAPNEFDLPIDESFRMPSQRIVIPLRKPNLDYLSRSDIECLDAAIGTTDGLRFGALKKLTHDAAFLATPRNGEISLEDIVRTLPNAELLLDHIMNSS